jgi:hypothetical protein
MSRGQNQQGKLDADEKVRGVFKSSRCNSLLKIFFSWERLVKTGRREERPAFFARYQIQELSWKSRCLANAV